MDVYNAFACVCIRERVVHSIWSTIANTVMLLLWLLPPSPLLLPPPLLSCSSLVAAIPCTIVHHEQKPYLLMNRSYIGTLWMLCVWVITIISINAGKHFAAPCLSNHLFMKRTECEKHTHTHEQTLAQTVWGTSNNMAAFPEFNWLQNCIDNFDSNMNQFKCRKYGRWWSERIGDGRKSVNS